MDITLYLFGKSGENIQFVQDVRRMQSDYCDSFIHFGIEFTRINEKGYKTNNMIIHSDKWKIPYIIRLPLDDINAYAGYKNNAKSKSYNTYEKAYLRTDKDRVKIRYRVEDG